MRHVEGDALMCTCCLAVVVAGGGVIVFKAVVSTCSSMAVGTRDLSVQVLLAERQQGECMRRARGLCCCRPLH